MYNRAVNAQSAAKGDIEVIQ
jgi:hypothetical protein